MVSDLTGPRVNIFVHWNGAGYGVCTYITTHTVMAYILELLKRVVTINVFKFISKGHLGDSFGWASIFGSG